MQRSGRRARLAALVIVVVASATAGVTRLGPSSTPERRAAPGAARPEVGVQLVDVQSSTRGALTLGVSGDDLGAPPNVPGRTDLAAAAAGGGAGSPVAAGESPPAGTEGAGAESVIGPDDGRIWLRGVTSVYPNAAIGRLDFRLRGQSYWCTATLIDADTVLTAGHCVHEGGSSDPAGWSTRVEFSPGIEGNTAPFGSCGATELLTLDAWYTTGSEYHDLGLVQLDCTIGDTVGWFGYQVVTTPRGLRDVAVQVRGYPGDKVWGSLWTMRDRIRASQGRMAFYQADTYSGQSGAPVYANRDCNGARGPCILAVHAYGVHGATGPHAENNHGARITPDRAGVIAQLAAAN